MIHVYGLLWNINNLEKAEKQELSDNTVALISCRERIYNERIERKSVGKGERKIKVSIMGGKKMQI